MLEESNMQSKFDSLNKFLLHLCLSNFEVHLCNLLENEEALLLT
ncbi:10214_t:CDS:2 [Dentiscutata erythropus]|uniref:10214_t:CDS:1 n=1 Tax=Dentiscutata erythropus TaxID=1348616 RepID=A0A9N9DJP7_9GLOM|nr:10214_t:CDS:2 [Dentiscutata erythropus]